MRIVLDTNIIISALLHDSVKRAIIAFSGLEFCYPKEAMAEIEKYREYILEKSGLEEREFDDLLGLLFSEIILIEQKRIDPCMEEARRIMDKIDPKDMIFIACALALSESSIWSDDRHFRKQKKIRILNQRDVLGFL